MTELFAASETVLYGRAFSTEADASALFRRPRFDPERDAWMAVDAGGSVVGYAEVWEREPEKLIEGFAVVHPGSTGCGLGSLFVELIEGRAAERSGPKSVTLRNVTPAADAAAGRLLASTGYERVRRFQHMAIELGGRTPAVPVAEGIVVRGFDPEPDAQAVHALLQEAFAENWEFAAMSYERWRSSWIDVPSFDPSLWHLARAGEELIGAVLAMARPESGWIIDIGVAPAWRGRGAGGALLLRTFEAFRARGTNLVELNVDAENPTGAVRLYERLGMTVSRSWDLYDKAIGQLRRGVYHAGS